MTTFIDRRHADMRQLGNKIRQHKLMEIVILFQLQKVMRVNREAFSTEVLYDSI